MKHTIKLRFFLDKNSGEWGLAHQSTYSEDTPFNAFWSGIGIFHDVFEHWFENEHKYFKGDAAMNVGGEMTAMGGYLYFVEDMGLSNRNPRNSYYSNAELMRDTTESEIIEAVSCGYTNFGSTLICNVPKQKPCDNSELDYQCEKLYNNVKKSKLPANDSEEYEAAKEYKKSVTLSKIITLHRYGYKLAEKMFPNNWENRNTLNDFIEYFNNFTKNNSAEEIATTFKGMTITVTKKNGILNWSAKLIPMYGNDTKAVKLNKDYCPTSLMEEIYLVVR